MDIQAQQSDFANRLITLAKVRSPLCVGVDPSIELLQAWRLSQDEKGLAAFCDYFMEAADGELAIIKPQIAFFEQFGPRGLEVLVRLGNQAREQGTLFLIDCKRGDVGHTAEAYARSFLGTGSPFFADAITVSPYLGFGALRPICDRATQVGAGVFVVVHSSNLEGRILQNAHCADGETVADAIACEITCFNGRLGRNIGPIGAVIGATGDSSLVQTLNKLPHSLFLTPGIGAQGATFEDLIRNFAQFTSRMIPSVSRAVLGCGPTVSKLKEAMRQYRETASLLL